MLSAEAWATALYRAIFEREPESATLASAAKLHSSSEAIEGVIRTMIGSAEFRTRVLKSLIPDVDLPDLAQSMPDRYAVEQAAGGPLRVYMARCDDDIADMARLIESHRYYDRFGAATPVIDLDKEITAAIVRGLGAKSCFELGCFTGTVLSLLADRGLRVLGTEASHLAFVFACANIRDSMLYGDVLSLPITQRFDVVLCMDVLEHLSPLRLDAYLEKLLSLLDDDGHVYVNSPMFGNDAVFGTVEAPYLAEWQSVGDASYWYHWLCDERGWPLHGHLIWASPAWWTEKFASHGLVRDPVIENAIHLELAGFFEYAIGRRSLFVLRRAADRTDSAALATQVAAALSQVPGIPDKRN